MRAGNRRRHRCPDHWLRRREQRGRCGAYFDAGATVVGIGSALIGLTTDETAAYFRALASDLAFDRNRAESHIRYDIDMHFEPVTLVDNKRVCEDIAILTFDRKINVQAGEFIFLWLPGLGEKPFSA